MDAYEATKMVFSRIQAMDPDNAATVMGVLLIQDPGEQEMIRLAFGPDSLLRAVIADSLQKQQFAAVATPTPATAASPAFFPTAAAAAAPPPPPPDFDDDPLCGLHNAVVGPRGAVAAADQGAGGRCLYFSRGYCKNGPGCRFFHHHGGAGINYNASDADDDFYQTQLQQQHQQPPNTNNSTNLLSSPRLTPTAQQPLPPSSPNAAYPHPSPKSLTALNQLLRLQQLQHHHRRQQQLLQRAEDEEAAANTLRLLNNMRAAGPQPPAMYPPDMLSPASRQIYLTFPADSTFTEEDVSNYFSIYGPVQDVRIPYQQKRMFGFVSFVYPETVRMVLAKGNPHFVCDSRVLVKPYKEKPKIRDNNRKPFMSMMSERNDFSTGIDDTGYHQIGYHPLEGSRMVLSGSQEAAALLRRKMEEDQQAAAAAANVAALQHAIELQRKRFTGLQMLDLNGHHREVPSPLPPVSSHPSPNPIFAPPTGDTTTAHPAATTCAAAAAAANAVHISCNGTEQATKIFALGADGSFATEPLHAGETVAGSDNEVDASDTRKGTPEMLNAEDDAKFVAKFVGNTVVSEAAARGGGSGFPGAEGPVIEDVCLVESSEQNQSEKSIHTLAKPPLVRNSFTTISEELELLGANTPTSVASINPCFQMPRFPAGRGAVGM